MNADDMLAALTARVTTLEADNARLRLLLDGRDAPAELRHRLSVTLGLLREIIQRSAESRPEATAYADHLGDRLIALARVHGAIDRNGELDLHTAFVDELMIYTVQEGEKFTLIGPEILLQPRAAQTLGIVIHELAVNAVEHGAAATPGGRIDVSWRLDERDVDPWLTLVWKETGLSGLIDPLRRGFGMEALRDMVGHDLSACTDLAFEQDGLRWTIRFPFPPRIGRVAENSRD